MGFFGKLFGNEGEDTTVTDFQAATAAAAASAAPVATQSGQLADTAPGSFRLVVEDVFSITGRGTVVTGTVDAGTVAVGDRVTIANPAGTRVSTVTGIEMFKKRATTAGPGDNIGLLLDGIGRADIDRGAVITLAS